MLVKIKWRYISGKKDPKWDWCRALYAYLTVDRDEILYLGKAYKCSVIERWHRAAKKGFWNELETQRGIKKHVVMVGDIFLPEGSNLTDPLISDIESLLIKRINPWGNLKSVKKRISRPGLRVECKGSWHGWKREYRDIG